MGWMNTFKISNRFVALSVSFMIALPSPTFAVLPTCDATVAGRQMWDINDIEQYDMQFCDGANWFTMAITPKGASNGDGATCSLSLAGKIVWDSVNNEYQFCDDADSWWAMKGRSITTCTAGEKGKQRYNSSVMQFCDGTNWYSMGPTVVHIDLADNTYGVGANKSFTVPIHTGMTITAWGGGGGGGGASSTSSGSNGTTGSTTSVTTPLDTIVAAGGAFGKGGVSNSTSLGGAGGSGTTGAILKTSDTGQSTDTKTGGYGGNAYKGGKGGNPARKSGLLTGGIPGGGGAGGTASGPSSRRGGGGGGGGGYAYRAYYGTLTVGQTITMTIGAGGAGGTTGSGNAGGAGRVTIVYW